MGTLVIGMGALLGVRCAVIAVRAWADVYRFTARERARRATLVELALVVRSGATVSDGGVDGITVSTDPSDAPH